MSTLRPVIVSILVALQAVGVHVQRLRADEVAGGSACQRRLKVLRAFFRAHNVPFSRILRLPPDHADRRRRSEPGPDESLLPSHLWTNQTMHPIQPTADQWRDDVGPVNG